MKHSGRKDTKANSVAEKLNDWHEEHISIEKRADHLEERISDPEDSNLEMKQVKEKQNLKHMRKFCKKIL